MKIQAILCVCILLIVLMLTPAAWAAEELPSIPSALEEASLPPQPQETASPEPTAPPDGNPVSSDVPMEEEPSFSPPPTLEPSLSPEPAETPAPSPSPSVEETDIIRVSVPDFGKIILNPYGLEVEVDGETSCETILSSSYPITNLSEFPVAVHVQAVGKVSEESGATFSANPLLPGTQDKCVFMYAEFQNHEDAWAGQYTGAANQVVITKQPIFRENILVLGAPGEGYFRVFGDMAGASLWNKSDTVGASMLFTFSMAETGTA